MTDVTHALSALEVSARVAHGGMASIYLATREVDGDVEEVAVKVLHSHLAEDPHMRRMFLHEAMLASELKHPNVVHVFDQGEDESFGTFIVMEYVRGADLAGVLKAAESRRRRVDPRVVARLLVDVCRGLHAAHTLRSPEDKALNLVHRDVSPHNILIGDDGVARLTDFGIAKSDERYTMTRPGQLKGKLSYMAPEQLAHEEDPDRRVDVFAAGVVLWEALLTKRLFKGEDEISTINKVLLSKIEAPSRLYQDLAPLDAVVARALAREPAERFQTAAEMADALTSAAEPLGGLADRAECRAELTDLLEDELARRAERVDRASITPTLTSHDSLSLDLTPHEPPGPSGRWVGVLIGLLALLIAVCGSAIAWIVLTGPDPAPSASPAAPAAEPLSPSVQGSSTPGPEPAQPEPPEPAPPRPAPPPEATPTAVAPPPAEPATAPGPRRAPTAETAAAPPSPYDDESAGSDDGLPPMEGTLNPYGD